MIDRLDHKLDSNIKRLTNKDLEVLLRWKGVLPSKMGNRANKRALYQQFAGDRGDDDLGDPAGWMEADEANLEELRNVPIEMGDTAYGRFEARQKRDAKQAYQKMTLKEKESFRWKIAEIDKADADDGQSPPSNPTAIWLTHCNQYLLHFLSVMSKVGNPFEWMEMISFYRERQTSLINVLENTQNWVLELTAQVKPLPLTPVSNGKQTN